MTLHGQDLSHNNYLLDEHAALTAVDFTFIKAGEAPGVHDGAYPRWAPILAKAGKLWAPYLFCHPENGNAQAHADFLWDLGHAPGLPIAPGYVVDIERGPYSAAYGFDRAVSHALKAKAGKDIPVGTYCARDYGQYLAPALHGTSDWLWLATLSYAWTGAEYDGDDVFVNQNTWTGKPAGGGSAIDTDLCAGDANDFRRVVYGEKPAPIPPAEPGSGTSPAAPQVPHFPLGDVVHPFIAAAHGGVVRGLGKAEVLNRALAREVTVKIPDIDVIDGSTVAAYAAWQRKCGFTGADANGIPGRGTLRTLAKATRLFTTD